MLATSRGLLIPNQRSVSIYNCAARLNGEHFPEVTVTLQTRCQVISVSYKAKVRGGQSKEPRWCGSVPTGTTRGRLHEGVLKVHAYRSRDSPVSLIPMAKDGLEHHSVGWVTWL
jgi:hypothetical protein